MTAQDALCPHCNAGTGGRLAWHSARCWRNPAVSERIEAALRSDTPGVAVSASEYKRRAAASGLPSLDDLRRKVGPWSEVVRRFGLTAAVSSHKRTKRDNRGRWEEAEAEIRAYAAWAQSVRRAERAGKSYTDSSTLQRTEDGAVVRVLPDGTAWEV